MARINKRLGMAVLVGVLLGASSTLVADSNISSASKWGWGENVGWLNWADAGDGVEGVRVHPDHMEGFVWGENIGFINVGNGGGPYANTDHTDFGVNIDPGTGTLSGFAWGENVGWINFDTDAELGPFNQEARYDEAQDRFFGYAWGENIGWINLDDSTHFVATLCDGDADGSGGVDVNDISFVIFRLGNSGGSCIDGDVDGNGSVNANDISYVIFRLGTCGLGGGC